MTALSAWLTLEYSSGLSLEAIRGLLAHYGTPEAIVDATYAQIAQLVGERAAKALKSPTDELGKRREQYTRAALDWVSAGSNDAPKRHILTWDQAIYPQQLLTIPDPPLVLCVLGEVAALSNVAVGVVGARNATQQGLANARLFSEHFTQHGVTVISGMALGIDAAAHEGAIAGVALSESKRLATVAVVGTGIDRVYPAAHRDLAHAIANHGAIVSEFPVGTPPKSENFPRRNRVISGLSRGVLVVEAALRSGSLITARVAGEQGRDVLAIPGSIHAPLAKGCHQLIKQGAKLVEAGQDVLEELHLNNPYVKQNPVNHATTASQEGAGNILMPGIEDSVLNAMGHSPIGLDDLMAATGSNAATLLSRLTELELFGLIEALPGGRYQRLVKT